MREMEDMKNVKNLKLFLYALAGVTAFTLNSVEVRADDSEEVLYEETNGDDYELDDNNDTITLPVNNDGVSAQIVIPTSTNQPTITSQSSTVTNNDDFNPNSTVIDDDDKKNNNGTTSIDPSVKTEAERKGINNPPTPTPTPTPTPSNPPVEPNKPQNPETPVEQPKNPTYVQTTVPKTGVSGAEFALFASSIGAFGAAASRVIGSKKKYKNNSKRK